MKPKDLEFYKKMITHDVAVEVLHDISKALSQHDVASFYGYYNGSEGEFNHSARTLVYEIQRLVRHDKDMNELRRCLAKFLK